MIKKTRNKFEKKIELQLKKAKVSFKYESERIPYIIAGHYIPDFILTTADGGKIYLETKGHFRPEAKRKMAAVKRLNPQYDLRILFYSKKAKDIRWAEKHGFIYAIETIPEEWLTICTSTPKSITKKNKTTFSKGSSLGLLSEPSSVAALSL